MSPRMPPYRFEIAIDYPAGGAPLHLRTSDDWDRDQPATELSADGTRRHFHIDSASPFLYFKAVRVGSDGAEWARGENRLALPGETAIHAPWFAPDAACSYCALHRLDPAGGATGHRYRVYYPPGYAENPLARYPVVYMHDGQNLFLAEEAFAGATWETSRTLELLTGMNAIEPALVVGVFPGERNRDYTRDGWDDYARFLVRDLKPEIDRSYRTLPEPSATSVMGSSLGGVVSFHLGWSHPEVFGQAACLSSTFGWGDDLAERIRTAPRPATRFYLDSGWPHDNYEVTRLVYDRLRAAGYRDGSDLLYLTFPGATHDERSWSLRSHVPLQFLLRPPTGSGRTAGTWGATVRGRSISGSRPSPTPPPPRRGRGRPAGARPPSGA